MENEMTAEEFNKHFKPGQAVYIELDDGGLVETYLRTEAWECCGTAVARVDAKRSAWDVDRIHNRDGDN